MLLEGEWFPTVRLGRARTISFLSRTGAFETAARRNGEGLSVAPGSVERYSFFEEAS